MCCVQNFRAEVDSLCLNHSVIANYPPPVSAQDEGVCGRTSQVSEAIVAASGVAGCAKVESYHLREIVSLDLGDQEIESLRVSDFNGLVRLETLDLSDNQLTSLPQGIFDELYMLRRLFLDNNSLGTVSADLFEELFLLEELTLHGNGSTVVPDGLFEELSRFDGIQANGNPSDNSGAYPRIKRFLNQHNITNPEEFIASLPPRFLQRFVLVFQSESPAALHVSGDHPRVISWGADGEFIFAWTTDPDAPSSFHESIEFLRQDEVAWSVGVIDFSGATPEITEPAFCKGCHGSLGKPLWGQWNVWSGTEYVHPNSEEFYPEAPLYLRRAMDSTDARLEPLDFSVSSFEIAESIRWLNEPGHSPHVTAAEEAGAVWSWRHAEILFRLLGQRGSDLREMAETLVCSRTASSPVLLEFDHSEHNLGISAATEVTTDHNGNILSPLLNDLISSGYSYGPPASLPGAVNFLIFTDLWAREPMVRHLYRKASNTRTVPDDTYGEYYSRALLHYASGSASAEDELIQRLRIHFGRGSRTALETRAGQNGRIYLGGLPSGSFWRGHVLPMKAQICSAVRESRPLDLRVSLADGNVDLAWKAPAYDPKSVTGYRILRSVDGNDAEVLVADTGSTDTTWTDESPPPGDYVYTVKAFYDGYYPSPESHSLQTTIVAFPGAVQNLTANLEPENVTLSWEAPTGEVPVTGYRILRGSTASSLQVIVANTGTTDTTYIDTTAETGKTYFYSVVALNGNAAGPESEPVRVGTAPPVVTGSTTFTVVEGDTAVGALTATDEETPAADLVWSISGGADRSSFTLSSGGALAFASAKDFEAPDDVGNDGTYNLMVQVSNGTTYTSADISVTLSNKNEAPTADAGTDLNGIEEGATVTLNGTGEDPDANDTLTYAWTQTGGTAVTLSTPKAATTTFTAPTGLTENETLRFTLLVTDAGGLSAKDETEVTVQANNDDASLSALSLSGIQISFASASTVYSAEVASDVNSTLVTATPNDVSASVVIADADGSTAGTTRTVNLSEGVNTITITVTAEDSTTTQDYTVTVTREPSLTAEFENVPQTHDGSTAFKFQLRFSEEIQMSYLRFYNDVFDLTGGTMEKAKRLNPPSNIGWDITVKPNGDGQVSIVLPADRACDVTGAICTSDGKMLSEQISITVDAVTVPLTAEFENVPQTHDGSTAFKFQLRFSEEIQMSHLRFYNDVFDLTGGTMEKAKRLNPPSNIGWDITVKPNGDGQVSIVLPADRACDVTGAICTSDGKMLSEQISITVDAVTVPLTAEFENVPQTHDGSTAFKFQLRFSEEIQMSHLRFYNDVFDLTGGTMEKAKRLNPPSNIGWDITVKPNGTEEISITLPETRDCTIDGAACTARGKKLSAPVEETVAGP